MNNWDQAEEKMLGGFFGHLKVGASSGVFTQTSALGAAKIVFDTAYDRVKKLAEKIAPSDSGYSEARVQKKEEMGRVISSLAGYAKTKFELLGMTEEAGQLLIHPNDYTDEADAVDLGEADAAITLMESHLTYLTDEYVSEADITHAKEVRDAFAEGAETSTMVNQASPEDRIAFKGALKIARAAMERVLLLARRYEISHSEFYKELVRLSHLGPVAVRHTTLGIHIYGPDKKPMRGVHAALSNSKKTGISDAEGFVPLDKIRSGTPTLTLTAPDGRIMEMKVAIEQGKKNGLDVTFE